MTDRPLHPMLTFWMFRSYGGVGTSWVHQTPGNSDRCPACSHDIQRKSFENAKIHIAGSGSKWPDLLACNLPIFHDRVVKSLKEASLTGFIAHPAEIVEIAIKKLRSTPVPNYFLIEITGRVDIDQNELDDYGGSICPICFTRTCKIRHPYQWKAKRVFPKLETWDGSDFVITRNWHTGHHYCSNRVIGLACKHRWTNFVFESLLGFGLWGKPPRSGMSYYDSDWAEKFRVRAKIKHPEIFRDNSSA